MFDFFTNHLRKRQQKHLHRKLDVLSGVDLVSNDYLNLSEHEEIKKILKEGLDKGVSLSGKSSRLLAGTSLLHQQTEKQLQDFTQRPGVLSFSSGYLANIGALPSLAKDRTIFSDELIHASLIDGISLSKRPYVIYPHQNLQVLEEFLKNNNTPSLIVTESLFSMKGSFSDLRKLADLALKYQALLYVDEAHATGLFGSKLAGFVSDLDNKDHIISCHTFGKALGSTGAFLACSQLIQDYLINTCRSFIYTTAISPLVLLSYQAILDLLKKEKHRALELRKTAHWMRSELAQFCDMEITESPIIPIYLGDSKKALALAETLRKHGFAVQAVRPPTVPEEQTGIRLIIKYGHSKKMLGKLIKLIQDSVELRRL